MRTLIGLISGRTPQRDSTADADDPRLAAQWAAFAASLAETTGRDLAGWAELIAHFRDKDDAILFLEGRGFRFLHASWVERWRFSRCNPFATASQEAADLTRSTRRKGPPKPASARAGYVTARQLAQSARVHASALLVHLQATHAGEEVLASDVEAIYLDLCDESGWAALRWRHKNGVAHHLRALNGNAKTYRDVIDPQGRRRRLSVYPISPPVSAQRPARRRRQEAADQTRIASPPRAAVAA
jgi:hypothetical protein